MSFKLDFYDTCINYSVLDELSWTESHERFDVVSCLNVLDRCEKPLELLSSIRRVLQPTGLAIVSFVIPFKPYVEFGEDIKTHRPKEVMPIEGSNYEEEVNNFIEKVLIPSGWEVVKWTRLPYICEGDIKQAYYWLDDAVFVIRSQLETT